MNSKKVFSIAFTATATFMLLAAPASLAYWDDNKDSRSSQDRYDRNDRNSGSFEPRYDRSSDRGIIPPYVKERMDSKGEPRS